MTTRATVFLDEDEIREASIYAMYRHIGGRNPVAILLKELAFAQMRKYPIPEAIRARLEEKYDKKPKDPQAVQPDLL